MSFWVSKWVLEELIFFLVHRTLWLMFFWRKLFLCTRSHIILSYFEVRSSKGERCWLDLWVLLWIFSFALCTLSIQTVIFSFSRFFTIKLFLGCISSECSRIEYRWVVIYFSTTWLRGWSCRCRSRRSWRTLRSGRTIDGDCWGARFYWFWMFLCLEFSIYFLWWLWCRDLIIFFLFLFFSWVCSWGRCCRFCLIGIRVETRTGFLIFLCLTRR